MSDGPPTLRTPRVYDGDEPVPVELRLRHLYGLLTEAIQLAEELAEQLPERREQATERIERLKLSAGLAGPPPP